MIHFLVYKDSVGILQTVYLGSPSLEYTKGAVFLQHGEAAIRMGPTGRTDARKIVKPPGAELLKARKSGRVTSWSNILTHAGHRVGRR